MDAVFKYDALTELPYDFETFFFHTYWKKQQTVRIRWGGSFYDVQDFDKNNARW